MSFFPDWMLVSLTGLALCAAVVGKWRWAALPAAPALVRFILWPLVWHYLITLPAPLLALLVLIIMPVLLLRGLHLLLGLASSQAAADHAVGDFLGRGLTAAARRLRLRR